MTVAKHSLSCIPSLRETQEYHPLSLASFCPPSLPPHPTTLVCRVAGSASLSNLHCWPEKHWARCWHAGLIPHRGWQIISQPLCAEWGQPASESVQPGSRILKCAARHETICLDKLCSNGAGGNVGATRSANSRGGWSRVEPAVVV